MPETAASWLPLADEAIPRNCSFLGNRLVVKVHAMPEFVDNQIPSTAAAASLFPSDDEAMDVHCAEVGGPDARLHVMPEFEDNQMPPPVATAASLVPSEDEATDRHGAPLGNPEGGGSRSRHEDEVTVFALTEQLRVMVAT